MFSQRRLQVGQSSRMSVSSSHKERRKGIPGSEKEQNQLSPLTRLPPLSAFFSPSPQTGLEMNFCFPHNHRPPDPTRLLLTPATLQLTHHGPAFCPHSVSDAITHTLFSAWRPSFPLLYLEHSCVWRPNSNVPSSWNPLSCIELFSFFSGSQYLWW